MNYVFVIFISITYFLCSYFLPLQELLDGSKISISYLFDLLFVFVVYLLLLHKPRLGKINLKSFLIRLISILLLGTLSVYCLNAALVKTPYKYIESLFLQLLILSPIMEAFVFRGAFFTALKRTNFKDQYILVFISFLCGLSHLLALKTLPVEFYPFLIIQVVYATLMAQICGKSRLRTGGLLEGIGLHFIFNLIFYIAIKHHYLLS